MEEESPGTLSPKAVEGLMWLLTSKTWGSFGASGLAANANADALRVQAGSRAQSHELPVFSVHTKLYVRWQGHHW